MKFWIKKRPNDYQLPLLGIGLRWVFHYLHSDTTLGFLSTYWLQGVTKDDTILIFGGGTMFHGCKQVLVLYPKFTYIENFKIGGPMFL